MNSGCFEVIHPLRAAFDFRMKTELLLTKCMLQKIEINLNFKEQYLKNTAKRALRTNELFLQFNKQMFQHVDEHVLAKLNKLVMFYRPFT